MKKKHYTEQNRLCLTTRQAGTPIIDLCREPGISEQTFYRWRRKYASLGVPELRRLKPLEKENQRLKQLLADLTLDKHMLQEVITKKL